MRYFLVLAFLFLSFTLSATTYYIDPSGSDSNNGSSSSPWKTLSYACSKATVSGDIIHVNAGTYTETSQSVLSAGVSIVGAGRATTIITLTWNTSGQSPEENGAVQLASGSANTNGNQSISNITFYGNNYGCKTAMVVWNRSSVIIHDVKFQYFNLNGVSFVGDYTTHSQNNQLYNCTMIDCSQRGGGYGSIRFVGQDRLLVHHNILTNTGRPLSYNGNLINSVSGHSSGFKFYNNICTKPNYDGNPSDYPDGRGWNFAIEIWSSEGGYEYYNNEFYGCDEAIDIGSEYNDPSASCGNFKGSYTYSNYIHNNLFQYASKYPKADYNGNKFCITIEGSRVNDVIIAYNHFVRIPVPINLTFNSESYGPYNNISIYYNIFEDSGYADSGFAGQIYFRMGGGSTPQFNNITVDNNVMTGGSNGSTQGAIVTYIQGDIKGLEIKNNIIENSTVAWLYCMNWGGKIYNLTSESNILYSNANGNTISDANSVIDAATQINRGNTIGNPNFVSSTDFHLLPGSPAIGKGLSISGLTADYAGTPVNNPPNIGAYESGSTVSSPVIPVYQSSVVQNATPALLEMTYDNSLASVVPAVSSFSVLVNSSVRTVSAIAVSGTKVILTLASRVVSGDVVKVSYTKPASNYLQTTTAGIAASLSNLQVTNNCVNSAPVAVLTSPVTNSSFSSPASISINATATDSDGSVKLVEFYTGTTMIGSVSSAPYSFTWNNVTAGIYTLTAAVTDNQNAKTVSPAVTISVADNKSTPNKHPVIRISNPHKGNSYENLSTVTIDAVASDPDGSISKVEFYNGSERLVEVTTTPYSYIWKDVAPGTYKVTAIATDNLNDTTVSSPVEFVIASKIKYDANSEIVKLYPNPNNGQFSIEFLNPLKNDKSEIVITDMSGKQVYNGPVMKEEVSKKFDLSDSKSGVYVMLIKDKDILVTKKFIKN